VLGPQIAVSVDDAAFARTLLQQTGLALQRGVESVQCLGRAVDPELRPQQHLATDRLLALESHRVLGAVDRDHGGVAIEVRKPVREPVDLAGLQHAVGDRPVEHAPGRQAPHPDQPVKGRGLWVRLSFGHQAQRAGAPLQQHQASVDAGRQTGIQAHLLATGRFARRGRREVEERVAHRLLQLERLRADQEHPRHVGFDRLDRFARRTVAGMRRGTAEKAYARRGIRQRRHGAQRPRVLRHLEAQAERSRCAAATVFSAAITSSSDT